MTYGMYVRKWCEKVEAEKQRSRSEASQVGCSSANRVGRGQRKRDTASIREQGAFFDCVSAVSDLVHVQRVQRG